jgi:uroporphyrinogen-III synthase
LDGREGVELLARTSIVTLDPTTARAVEELGLRVAAQPQEASDAALADALVDLLRGPPGA